MNKQLAIILASHGGFANGALACAEMLIGDIDNIATVTIDIDSNINEIRQQLAKQYDKLNNENGVLILTDLLGGTPCNLSAELALTKDNIALYAGFNMPVLLEVLTNRHLTFQQICPVIDELFPQSCVNVLAASNTENNDQDFSL